MPTHDYSKIKAIISWLFLIAFVCVIICLVLSFADVESRNSVTFVEKINIVDKEFFFQLAQKQVCGDWPLGDVLLSPDRGDPFVPDYAASMLRPASDSVTGCRRAGELIK